MKPTFRPLLKIGLFLLFLSSILLVILSNSHAEELSDTNYEKNKDAMGVVLVAVNWGRQWGCGKYENAQLENLKFELFPENGEVVNEYSLLDLKSPSRLFVNPEFKNYGFLLSPGQYAMTGYSVKAAKSVTDVGYLGAGKTELIKDGNPEGGIFTVKAGEIVYIGNFFLDCYYDPMPWRYYSEGWDGFNKHVAEFKQQYKFLENKNIVYRLFKTKSFGNDYELPNTYKASGCQ